MGCRQNDSLADGYAGLALGEDRQRWLSEQVPAAGKQRGVERPSLERPLARLLFCWHSLVVSVETPTKRRGGCSSRMPELSPAAASDLRFVDDAVVQPVGHVLRGDPQGCTVLHQRDVVDVRDFRAPTGTQSGVIKGHLVLGSAFYQNPR